MDREAFLNRIAGRLGRQRRHEAPERRERGVPEFYREAPLGSAQGLDLCERFKLELENVGGEALLVDSLPEAHAALRVVLARWHAQRIVTWARPELAEWQLDWLWRAARSPTGENARARAYLDPGLEDEQALRTALLSADVGITAVDFAVANTGTLVVSAAPGRPRSVSLLPTLHLALVKQTELVARLGEALAAYAALGRDGIPSALHCITGPSRTSDIENDLTIGVHGPAAVTAIVWRHS